MIENDRRFNVFLCYKAPALQTLFTPIQAVHALPHPFHQRPEQSLCVRGGWQLFALVSADTRLSLTTVIPAGRIVPAVFAYWEPVAAQLMVQRLRVFEAILLGDLLVR